MRGIKFYHAVQPFFAALAVIVTSAALVFTIYFTELGLQWTTFLAGLLVASILAEATRMSRSEWLLMRRTAQLSVMKDKFEHLTHLHEQDEKSVAAAESRLRLVDEAMPTMIALVDREGRCRYHNLAFRNWLHLGGGIINDRHMREILGSKLYAELATVIRQSLDGLPVSYEKTFTMPNGSVYHLSVEHIPQFDDKGKVTGFYILANDLTRRGDVHLEASPGANGTGTLPKVAGSAAVQGLHADQELFIDSFAKEVTGREDSGGQIFSAIENGEFNLFCQLITPLNAGSGEAEHYEILIRLREEEQNMMLPGAFFPLAEKNGLMPYLDRWVVQHVLQRVAIQYQQGALKPGSIFFINVARATIYDPEFPAFLMSVLKEYGVAGANLCFEVPDSENALVSSAVAEFVKQVRLCGCRVALSGFGRDAVSFNLIRNFQIEFLKIDGGIILGMLRDPVELAKVVAISRVAKKIGVKTVAEMVESDEAITKLREVGVDFAQGFGISRPHSFFE